MAKALLCKSSVLCTLDQPGMNARYVGGTHEFQWRVGVQLWIYFNICLEFMQYQTSVPCTEIVQAAQIDSDAPHNTYVI